MEWLSTLDPWVSHLIIGIYIVAVMGFGAAILVKVRRSPLWVFLLLIPYLGIIGIWLFAYARWPRYDDRSTGTSA